MIAALHRVSSQCVTVALLSLFLSLSACGGGGDGESASNASNSNRSTGGFSGNSSSSSSSGSSSGSTSSASSSSSSGGSTSSASSSSSSGTNSGGSPGTSSSSSSGGSSGSTATGTDVLTYHNDRMRTGQNLTEAVLTPANVTSATFGLLRTLAADDAVDAAPLIATNVSIGGSAHTVVYVATESDSVYAYDADSGALLLHVSLLASGETPSDTRSCGQVAPAIGITSTPVIDRSVGPNGTIFLVAMSKDSGGAYHQRLHALDLTTLADRVPAITIQATAPGSSANGSGGTLTFAPGDYKERGALLAVNGQIYTVWASHCDDDPYNGWIIAYDEATMTPSATLNYTPNGTRGAIWSVAGLAADGSGMIYGMAGNGTFDATLTSAGLPNQSDYGNAVLKLTSTSTTLTVADYWAATNTVSESASDTDLGSGSPLLLPDQTDATGTARHLLIGAGKDGNVLLLDRDSLGKFSPTANTAYQRVTSLLPGGLFSAFAYFNGSVYVADIGGTLKAFTLTAAQLPASPTSQSAATFAYPGSSPSVSANGTSNAILWALTSHSSAAAVLHAYNPANLQQEYYNSTQAANSRDAFGNGEKFITPVIANGKVFVGTPNGVAVFGLL
jgi:hypothetical protein